MKVKKAIIPAAGLGIRFLPATKSQPKEMLPIVDKPTIQYIIEEAISSGIEEILIITGRNKRSIEDHFDKSVELEMILQKKNKQNMLHLVQDISNVTNIYYIRQKEPNGLGYAIYCAKTFINDEPFAVLLGDDIVNSDGKPCIKQLVEVYEKYEATVLGVQEIEKKYVDSYGIIDGRKIDERVYLVNDLVEKPSIDKAPSSIAIIGRYIITPEIFKILEHTQPNSEGEIELTDALIELRKKQPIYAYNCEGKRYDVGNKLGFLKATVDFALKREDLEKEFMKYLEDLIINR